MNSSKKMNPKSYCKPPPPPPTITGVKRKPSSRNIPPSLNAINGKTPRKIQTKVEKVIEERKEKQNDFVEFLEKLEKKGFMQ